MMLHYQEALQKVIAAAPQLGMEELWLHAAGGRILGADVIAPIDHPLFDQSAVDGYALRFDDLADAAPLLVADHIQAGDAGDRMLLPGTCSRVFTGAPVPPGADTVVMQELTTRAGDQLQVHDAGLRRGGNVRPAGEQIRAGDLGLPKGSHLNPAAIGFLASLGIQKVPVAPRPRVRIIVTGDEFAEDFQDLQRGKIYESNGQMLVAAFAKLGIAATYQTCKDDAETLSSMVAGEIGQCDLLILTGGVSVGDFDFSRGALVANGFEVVFHEVAQKPGKPLLFCQRGQQLGFGLPGNPRAVLMCFYLYVLPLLGQMLGTAQIALRRLPLPLAHDYRRKGDGKTHFVTGKIAENAISLLDGQQSHMLQSLALADVIVVIGADVDAAAAGTSMDCFLLR